MCFGFEMHINFCSLKPEEQHKLKYFSWQTIRQFWVCAVWLQKLDALSLKNAKNSFRGRFCSLVLHWKGLEKVPGLQSCCPPPLPYYPTLKLFAHLPGQPFISLNDTKIVKIFPIVPLSPSLWFRVKYLIVVSFYDHFPEVPTKLGDTMRLM